MRRQEVAGLALIAALVFFVIFWGWGRRVKPFRTSEGLVSIEFLDVGQGDSILITSPEGKTALIDAGPSNRVVELLRDRGIVTLDLVVVSHHHADHYGGMAEVIRAFQPRVFLDADSPHATTHYLAVLRAVKANGITAIQAGDEVRTIALGSVNLLVFPQAPLDQANENNNSIGIRVEFGEFSALLDGDAERAERRWWIREVPALCADVNVLKLAHHGSRNGTDRAWLEWTRPQLAVASLGRNNEFGHPHPETIKVFQALKIPLKRTDLAGSITIQSDGHTWTDGGSSESAGKVAPAGLKNDRGSAGVVGDNPAEPRVRAIVSESIKVGRTRSLHRHES